MKEEFVYRLTWVREDGRDGMLTFEGDDEGLDDAYGFIVYLESQKCRDFKITKVDKTW